MSCMCVVPHVVVICACYGTYNRLYCRFVCERNYVYARTFSRNIQAHSSLHTHNLVRNVRAHAYAISMHVTPVHALQKSFMHVLSQASLLVLPRACVSVQGLTRAYVHVLSQKSVLAVAVTGVFMLLCPTVVVIILREW